MSEADDVTPRRTGLYGALRRALDRRGADRAVVVISLVLMAFCLDTGLAADDFIHKLIATGSTEIQGFVREPLDMFRFTSGHHTGQLQDDGILSWWAHPRGKLAFLRPLTSLTHYLDYQLWPEAEWMMHLHSLLWGALLLAGLLVLYRELITPRWVCALAMFLYALEDGRAWFGSWIAARNGVIACAISIWALVLHHRTRSSNFRPGYLFSPLVLLLALLSGEGAVAICAYLFAYAIFLDRGSLRERLLSIVPHAVVVVLWRAAYRAMGYGAAHSGLYFDPIAETPSFLHALSERAPILLFSQVGGTWSDGWSAVFPFPTLHRLLVWGSIFTVLVVGYALVPLWKRDATVRFGLTGALLSVIPASAAFSADRLLTWVAIGASIAIARLMAAYIDAPQVLSHSPVRALIMPPLMIFLFVGNVIIDPLFLPSRARGNVAMRDIIDRAHAGVPDDPSIEERHVIYVNPAAVPLAAYIPIERAARGEPRPQRQMWLATSESQVRVTREDERTLRVRQRGGYLLSPASQLMRNPLHPFEQRVVLLPGVRVEVVDKADDGRPSEILARFDRPLEDPRYLWLQWGETSYVPFTPPPVGQSVTLPASDWLKVVFGDALPLPFDGRLPAPKDPHWRQ